MEQRECVNGHIYDAELYKDGCPYCRDQHASIDFEKTSSPAPDEIEESRSVPIIVPEEIRKTTAPAGYLEQQEAIGKTRSVFIPTQGGEPVVGWLVCISGSETGSDYKLSPRTNTIGRGEEMDVRIKGDRAITSDTHAKIDYDVLNNNFYLLPANNRNTIYLNGAPVYAAQKLDAYDKIRIGKTDVLFVPFCCEKFVWPTEDKED